MTTLREVLAWTPEQLDTASRGLSSVGDDIHATVKALEGVHATLQGGWQGTAADAALSRLSADIAFARRYGKAVDAAESTLADGAKTLGAAKHGVTSAVAAAERDGCTVGRDGMVTGPPVPEGPLAPGASGSILEQMRAAGRSQQLATDHAKAITAAVQAAADADAKLAASFTGVDVPSNRDTAVVLMDAGTGGAASTVLAGKGAYDDIEKVIFAGTGAVAYGQFLRNLSAVRQASKILDVTKDPIELASSFHQWIDASSGVRKGISEFAAGDTPLWYQAMQKTVGKGGISPGWVSGGAKVLGKLSLALTVYEGAKDAMTGGGYDGARGDVTRVLGGAGAVGATVLLVSGAVTVAPVVVGIAAAATTVYGLWSAGNLVYDNRDKIADAGRKAWGAVKGWFR